MLSASPRADGRRRPLGIAWRVTLALTLLLLLTLAISLAQGAWQRRLLGDMQRIAGPLATAMRAAARLDRASSPMVSQFEELHAAASHAQRRTAEKLLRDSLTLFDEALDSLSQANATPARLEQLRQGRLAVHEAVQALAALSHRRLDLHARQQRLREALKPDPDPRPDADAPRQRERELLLLRARLALDLASLHALRTEAARLRPVLEAWDARHDGDAFGRDIASLLALREEELETTRVAGGALAQGRHLAGLLRGLTAELSHEHDLALREAAALGLERSRQAATAATMGLLAVAGVVAVAGIYIHLVVSRRLGTMAALVSRAGDRGAPLPRLPESPRDELGLLAGALNRHAEELRQRQEEIDAARRLLDEQMAIVDRHVLTLRVDRRGRVAAVSDALRLALGLREDELPDLSRERFPLHDHSRRQFAELWRAARRGNPWSGELATLGKDGAVLWLAAQATPLRDETGRFAGVSAIAQDVTDHKRVQELCITDPLTGLCNRLRLDETLATEIKRAQRHGHALSVVLADIDHFKRINDAHGHLTGDRVLRTVAGLIKAHSRAFDVVGRWGGEEFLVICPHTPKAGAVAMAEKIRSMVAEHAFETAGPLTMSLGVASTAEADTATDILHLADERLYRSKREGRDRVTG